MEISFLYKGIRVSAGFLVVRRTFLPPSIIERSTLQFHGVGVHSKLIDEIFTILISLTSFGTIRRFAKVSLRAHLTFIIPLFIQSLPHSYQPYSIFNHLTPCCLPTKTKIDRNVKLEKNFD